MFLGHVAVGFASKRLAPHTSLGWLMAAPILLDLVWPVFLVTGLEQVRIDPGNTAFTPLDFVSYPYSHSLLMAAVWGAALGGVYFGLRRRWTDSLVLTLGVVSHWVLDWWTHRPDLPLTLSGPGRYGLGLWNSVPGTVAVELTLFALGLWIYARMVPMTPRLWALAVFLLLIYAGNIVGPPPPNARAITVVGFAQLLIPLWAGWGELKVDKNSPSC
jgi:hypothetical protein